MSRRVLILGPSKSGKTSYLGSLTLAAALTQSGGNGAHRKVRPVSRDMVTLSETARKSILDGKFPAPPTADKTVYAFDYQADNIGYWTIVFSGDQHAAQFEMIDSPGGVLLPSEGDARAGGFDEEAHQQMRNELLQKAREANALLLILDAYNKKRAADFFISLPMFLNDVGLHPLPYDRIAVVLTKADQHFSSYGHHAENMARQSDPWPRAVELLTTAGFGELCQRVDTRKTEMAAGWASAYGFVPATGEANYCPKHNRLKVIDGKATFADIADSWRPFQLLDALSYLAVGEQGGMSLLKAKK